MILSTIVKHQSGSQKQETNPKTLVSSFEKLLDGIIADGRYQWTLLLVFLLPLSLFYSCAHFNYILVMSTPKHHCHVPGRNYTHFSSEEWDNLTIPWELGPNGQLRLSQCKMYNISQKTYDKMEITDESFTTLDCQHGWDYDRSSWKEAPVSQFNWVCDKKRYVTAILTANMGGCVTGSLILTLLSDRFGRKPIFYLALMLNLIFGNAMIYAPNFNYFIALKFLGATAFISVYQLPYIIVTELCGSRMRTITTYSTWLMFIVSNGCLSLAGWLIMEWKTFLLVTQLPLAIFIFYYRFIPESPRWLLSRGRLEECEEVLSRIASRNGVKFTDEMRQLLNKAHEEGKKKVSPTRIFSSFVLTKHFFLIGATKSLTLLCARTMNLSVHNMQGNIFINYVFLRSFEFPGDICSTFTTSYIGRRFNAILYAILASIFVIVPSFIVAETWPLIVMCGITKTFLRAEIFSCFSHTGEMFPTPVRATAYGIISIIGFTVGILAPTVIALGNSDASLPYYVLCGLCIAAAFFASFLPETMGDPLPQTFEEAKIVGKGQSYFSFSPKGNVSKDVKANLKETLGNGVTNSTKQNTE